MSAIFGMILEAKMASVLAGAWSDILVERFFAVSEMLNLCTCAGYRCRGLNRNTG